MAAEFESGLFVAREAWAAAAPDAECRAQLEHLREIVKFEEAEAAE